MSESIIKEEIPKKVSKSPLVLGIIGLVAWLLPIIGAPVNIAGILVSVKKLKSEKSGLSKAGLVLSIIGLILTIANSALGIYLRSKK